MKGLVIKSTGKWYEVVADDGTYFSCQVKGKLRLAGLRTTNPIAVGDRVNFEPEDANTGVISSIEDRQNYIIRKSVNLSKEAHIVACNIDRAFLVVTLDRPKTSLGFIDRFLVTADAYNIPVTLLFNKIDQYDEELMEEMEWMEDMYAFCGYDSMRIEAVNGVGIDAVRARMLDKISLVSGHSGVGKTTLINQLVPGLNLKTAEVSDSHNKGKHTTTFAEMHKLPEGGWIIDTPGVKGFGLVDIPKEELHHHFPEIFRLLADCKFHNCLHLNEPGCAVREAVEKTELPEERYRNYLAMYHEDDGPYRS